MDRPHGFLHGGDRRRRYAGVLLAVLLGAAAVPGAAAADDHEGGERVGEEQVAAAETKIADGEITGATAAPSAYFVQFAGEPVVHGGSERSVARDRESFLSDAASAGAAVEVRQEFGTLWNGVSVTAAEADLTLLARSPVVEAVFPVYEVEAPPQPQEDMVPQLTSALAMTGADIVQSELGLSGAGVRVGVIDTGVDYDHPDLGGTGEPGGTDFPTERVAFGYDFVGDDFNNTAADGADYSPFPQPDDDPDDCNGHGTHVAGIVGADGEVVGVAPQVTIGAYRVFGCTGSTTTDVMLQAMERSYDDGMDVVNMSIGSAFTSWQEYPTAAAGSALAREGIVVVASIGNSGPFGLHAAGAPGVGEDVIGVASFDNTMVTATAFTVSPGGEQVPYFSATGAPAAPTEGSAPITRLGDPGTPQAQACEPLEEDLSGRLVLLQRGGPPAPAPSCSFHVKAVHAQEAGAAGVVMYNNQPGLANPTVAGETEITIPFVSISEADGVAIDERIVSGDTEITWTEEVTRAPNPTGGLISSFSSFGLTADLSLKPDLGAPGGLIYSTYPLERRGGYTSLSGTSMSAPHVAGAAALLLEADPDIDRLRVRDVLQNTAQPAGSAVDPARYLEVVNRQGAGMIRIDDAVLGETSARPGKLELGQQDGGPLTVTVDLANESTAARTYEVRHRPALATSGTSNTWTLTEQYAAVTSAPTVTVPAGSSVPVDVVVEPPTGPPAEFGGFLEFASGDERVTVPYAGYNADLQDVEVLTDIVDDQGRTVQPLPALARITACAVPLGQECAAGGSWAIPVDQPTYTMEGLDVPTLLIHFEHQVRRMTWTAYQAQQDGSKGAPVAEGELARVKDVDYLARSAGANGFDAWIWDGTHPEADGTTSRVPDGDYVLEMTITKARAFNDDRQPATESYTSPAFTLEWGEVPVGPQVSRLWGYDRYSTSAQVAREFEPGRPVAYVATGSDYPDALAGAARAGAEEVPVLLTRPDGLPAATRIALATLEPQRIVVLGGPDAVAEEVVQDLGGYTSGGVTRVYGSDRYETAARISRAHEAGVDTAFLATGLGYPDALAAAARAGASDAPVLLTRTDELPGATRAELRRLQPAEVVVVGGEEAVSRGVEDELSALAGSVRRVAGADRYRTAAVLAQEYGTGVPTAHLATGTDFPDALSGAALAARAGGPMLLTRPDELPQATLSALRTLQPEAVRLLGGYGAVSEEIRIVLQGLRYG